MNLFKKKNLELRLLIAGWEKDYQITARFSSWEEAQKALKKRKNLIFFSFAKDSTLYYVGEILNKKQCEALPNKREAQLLSGLLDRWPVEKLIRTRSGAAPLYGDVAVVDKNLDLVYHPKQIIKKGESSRFFQALALQHTHC